MSALLCRLTTDVEEQFGSLGTHEPEELWCRLSDDEVVTTTKRRALPQGVASAYCREKREYFSGIPDRVYIYKQDNSRDKSLFGTQLTVSENHPAWNKPIEHKGKYRGDIGGNFLSTRKQCYLSKPDGYAEFVNTVIDYSSGLKSTSTWGGALLPCSEVLNGNLFPLPQNSSDAALIAAGTTAIARCKPAQPNASLANTLIELRREGLPKLMGHTLWKRQSAAAHFRGLADEHLNIEFGWKPLVADIVDSAIFVSDFNRLIDQYIKDAGKQVRRRYEFPTFTDHSESVYKSNCSPVQYGASLGAHVNPLKINQGRVVRVRDVTKKCWFSGAFVYYLPIDQRKFRKMSDRTRSFSKLIGLDLTPDVIWNATPWSWAVDWIANFGDIISNVQSWSNDGMCMRYGYIMEHTVCSDMYVFVGETGFFSKVQPCTVTFVTETKRRIRATPFGFGLQYGSFTDRQKGILAALGIARTGK